MKAIPLVLDLCRRHGGRKIEQAVREPRGRRGSCFELARRSDEIDNRNYNQPNNSAPRFLGGTSAISNKPEHFWKCQCSAAKVPESASPKVVMIVVVQQSDLVHAVIVMMVLMIVSQQ